MAGYSGTPLPKKLGVKAGHRVALLDAPDGFALEGLPESVTVKRDLRGKAPIDVALLFALSERALRARFPKAQARIAKDGGLWVCWPKKASGVATDLGDAGVRAYGLAQGLVDNKVCAVDETWSGLRFVWRVTDR
ncbi:MAG: DUF3052 domain-containing protein [Myxococcota bacterium]|nr:DUF3052 domain-containing protein [Myxococcota bacterium]